MLVLRSTTTTSHWREANHCITSSQAFGLWSSQRVPSNSGVEATISAPHRNPYNLNLQKLSRLGGLLALIGRAESPLWVHTSTPAHHTIIHRALNLHQLCSYLVTAAKALLKQASPVPSGQRVL